MRVVQSWWRSLVWISRNNPPQVVEAVMLGVALMALGCWWLRQEWPYLALNISCAVGTILLILVRETITPSTWFWFKRGLSIVLLGILLTALRVYYFSAFRI